MRAARTDVLGGTLILFVGGFSARITNRVHTIMQFKPNFFCFVLNMYIIKYVEFQGT